MSNGTASSIASSANVRDGLSIMMARMAQDQMRQEGAGAIQMIESAAEVGRQTKPSVMVSSSGRVDGYA